MDTADSKLKELESRIDRLERRLGDRFAVVDDGKTKAAETKNESKPKTIREMFGK